MTGAAHTDRDDGDDQSDNQCPVKRQQTEFQVDWIVEHKEEDEEVAEIDTQDHDQCRTDLMPDTPW